MARFRERCYCGATDCHECYPGCMNPISCDKCGEEFAQAYAETIGRDTVCPSCYATYFDDDDDEKEKEELNGN